MILDLLFKEGKTMNAIILNQLSGIARLYRDGLITKEEAERGAIETVKDYFGKIGDYKEFIDFVLN